MAANFAGFAGKLGCIGQRSPKYRGLNKFSTARAAWGQPRNKGCVSWPKTSHPTRELSPTPRRSYQNPMIADRQGLEMLELSELSFSSVVSHDADLIAAAEASATQR